MKKLAVALLATALLAVPTFAADRPRVDGVVKLFIGCAQPIEQRTTYEVARIVDLSSQAKFQSLIEISIAFNTFARLMMADHPDDPVFGCVGVITEAK
jgi:hypothetical protein